MRKGLIALVILLLASFVGCLSVDIQAPKPKKEKKQDQKEANAALPHANRA